MLTKPRMAVGLGTLGAATGNLRGRARAESTGRLPARERLGREHPGYATAAVVIVPAGCAGARRRETQAEAVAALPRG